MVCPALETSVQSSQAESEGNRGAERHYSQREMVEIGGVYRMGAEDFRIKNLSEDAKKMFRWIDTFGDKENLQEIAQEEGIVNLDATLAELKEQGGIEDDPQYLDYVRRIYSRLG